MLFSVCILNTDLSSLVANALCLVSFDLYARRFQFIPSCLWPRMASACLEDVLIFFNAPSSFSLLCRRFLLGGKRSANNFSLWVI
ncbi:hypothetical protein SAMN03084138_03954 [Enterovibrio norvegicus DSM 15893]|uniref:Uncharacterized protein n=1 Tax=Enterovibrio norvegicus DSM 15893 TaxID=1121869 RepID=A0A1I5VHH6_9GAMM|nr:hypothetical protein SAMN03084138_03954 [Enterovibrio norvegicus DSM 15893]